MSQPDHAERTAHEPRDPSLHKTILARVDEVNSTIRTFRLELSPAAGSINFLPGQWLDVFVPGIPKPGGFTITSPPSKAQGPRPQPAAGAHRDASPAGSPYLELAVQKSPENLVADWLWRPVGEILASEIRVRVGGSFVWPPPGVLPTSLRKLVFVAGGVGINPLMSIVSHLAERLDQRYTVEFLYSMRDPGAGSRDPDKMLFVDRLAGIFGAAAAEGRVRGRLRLFLTARDGKGDGGGELDGLGLTFTPRRITVDDIDTAIGADRRFCVVYICGVPSMTDEFVEKLASPTGLGLERHRILYEKWW